MADTAQPKIGGRAYRGGFGVAVRLSHDRRIGGGRRASAAVLPLIASMEPAKDTLALNTAEATRSRVVMDGEQTKGSFAIYPIHSLTAIAADGIPIPFGGWRARIVSPHDIDGRSSNESKLEIGR